MVFIRCLTAVLALAQPAICGAEDKADEWLNYKSKEGRHYKADVGVLYRREPHGRVTAEVAVIATGEGAEFRKWQVIDTKLVVRGELIRPDRYDNIYSTRESVFRAPAAVVFTAIGAAYGIYADECSSGAMCTVGGGTAGRSVLQKTVDTAGMAAGLGLLVSRARGEITGQKAVFELDPGKAAGIEEVKIIAEHTGTGRRKRLVIPVESPPYELPGESLNPPYAKTGEVSSMGYVAGKEKT